MGYCLVVLLLFLSFINNVYSKSIIKTLPGFHGELPFKLETGYVGVGEKEDVQLFYYFIESERSPENDPLIIWIPGGPGCSSLRALIYELGPLYFDFEVPPGSKPPLELNAYSFTKVANVIFLDTPVGSGFSYGKSSKDFKTSDTLSSKHVYEFLRKWLNDHPKFVSHPLYVTGTSYAGILVPIITQEIYNGNEGGNEPQINIKGYVVGNPLTDRDIDFNSRIKFAHRLALLSDELYESVQKNCEGQYYTDVDRHNSLCTNNLNEVEECLKHLYRYHVLEPSCDLVMGRSPHFKGSDGIFNTKNFIIPLPLPARRRQAHCRWETEEYYTMWANDEDVQRALHIREGTIREWKACNTDHKNLGMNDTATYSYDVYSTVAHHRNLTNKNCRALVFSGDHDMVFPYLGTQRWIRNLQLTVEHAWAPWFVEREVAGYRTTYSHNDYTLTFATVKGAGHVAPLYKRKESLAMVDRWFQHYPL